MSSEFHGDGIHQVRSGCNFHGGGSHTCLVLCFHNDFRGLNARFHGDFTELNSRMMSDFHGMFLF